MEAASTSSAASSVDGRSVGSGSDYLNLGMFSGAGSGGGSSNNNASSTSSSTQQQLHLQSVQHQQQELLGGASFGGASSLGNGFGNETVGTSFDLSDFPSLGGTGSNAQSVSSSAGNGLAAALRQQQQQQQQQQLLAQQQIFQGTSKSNNLYRLAMTGANGNFTMATEDFPALSGGPQNAANAGTNGSTLNATSSLLSSAAVTNATSAAARAPSNTHSGVSGLYSGTDLDNTAVGPPSTSQLDGGSGGLLGGAGLGGLGGLRGLQQPQSNPTALQPSTRASSSGSVPGSSSSAGVVGSSPASVAGAPSAAPGSAVAGSALAGDFGLLGLLGVIRMTDADRNALALGSDLTMLGLNLGSTEQIYSTFSNPWSDTAATKEPHYQVRGPFCICKMNYFDRKNC